MCINASTHAAIVYTPNTLSVDPISIDTRFDVNIGLPNGLIMLGSNLDRFFKLYIPNSYNGIASSPCISGNNAISFYYREDNHKQWIYCREAFVMSDANFKSDIQPMGSMLNIITQTPQKSRMMNQSQSLKKREFEYLSSIIPNGINIIDGDTIINYTELIPVLIQATKELREESARQEQEILELKQLISQHKSKINKLNKFISYTPNPATTQIAFTFNIVNSDNTKIVIADFNGNVQITQMLSVGQTQAEISIDQLQKGFYHAILIVNNIPQDVAKIIKN